MKTATAMVCGARLRLSARGLQITLGVMNLRTLSRGITASPQQHRQAFELSVGGDGRSSPYCFTLLLGQSERDADFAFAPFGSIGDLVFEDLDLDGVRDADEPGIEGVVVDLFDATGTLYDSVTTAGDGSYAFIDVAAGTYTVEVITPTGFSATNAGPDANGDDQARTSPYTTTAADGVANTLADFGFVAFTSVGDFVFIDTDGDGLLGANEEWAKRRSGHVV